MGYEPDLGGLCVSVSDVSLSLSLTLSLPFSFSAGCARPGKCCSPLSHSHSSSTKEVWGRESAKDAGADAQFMPVTSLTGGACSA